MGGHVFHSTNEFPNQNNASAVNTDKYLYRDSNKANRMNSSIVAKE